MQESASRGSGKSQEDYFDDGGVLPVVLDYKGAASVRDVYATGSWQALGTPSTI